MAFPFWGFGPDPLFNHTTNSTHYSIMKIPNKQELKQIAFNHLSDIDFKNVMNLYKKCTAKSYSFLVIDVPFALCNLLYFRKNVLEKM